MWHWGKMTNHAMNPRAPGALPSDLPGCLAFWNFDGNFRDQIDPKRSLESSGSGWEWVKNGVFGDQALRVRPGTGFILPRKQLGGLDIHGPGAVGTVCAWIYRESEDPWQALAGVWDESRAQRQYYLFLNARSRTLSGTTDRVACQNRVHGHVSDVGGPTLGLNCCVTYASGGSEIPLGRWAFVAMAFSGGTVRIHVNGALDTCPESNPFPVRDVIFDGGRDGADFTVAANSVRGVLDNFYGGLLGGVAVYGRALAETELISLAGV